MKVVFRVDASIQIGIGHVMRCLALAQGLAAKEHRVSFICRAHPGHLIEYIQQQGFVVFIIKNQLLGSNPIRDGNGLEGADVLFHAHWLGASQQEDAYVCQAYLDSIMPDWLIVDHYALDERWHKFLHASYKKLMVIDDLADRKHACQLLLDQTYGRAYSDYQPLVSDGSELLLGSSYALLRPEFVAWRDNSLQRRKSAPFKQLLISLGGIDKENVTSEVLSALKKCDLPRDLSIIVVMGSGAPFLSNVQDLVATLPNMTEVKVNVQNMAELMANSDIAIGAAGTTVWERCCLGLPSMVIMLAENQRLIFECLQKEQVVWVLKREQLLVDIQACFSHLTSAELLGYSRRSMNLVDGLGVDRVVQKLVEIA
ncbi:MAG: UDP-2,4-diacetamido-2,4,6-trideoxy-beta-L-altropyranose hydrolase [Methylococcaceae bacterium]|nr:UDP-2,4-diacetamido-2,4,6-trideoxy-beta-L-altropyranose hydrolase [Methylococcaceae bacterium]